MIKEMYTSIKILLLPISVAEMGKQFATLDETVGINPAARYN